MSEITELIGQARQGNRQASDQLFAALYGELKRLAQRQLLGSNPPLHATSLVHEVYCKLARSTDLVIHDRQHFYAIAARAMRQIVLNHVRSRNARRRGGDIRIEAFDTQAVAVAGDDALSEDVIALDAALHKLAELEPDLERLVELRFFAGLELSEITGLLDRSERSLKRDWRRARAFLYAELNNATQPAQNVPEP